MTNPMTSPSTSPETTATRSTPTFATLASRFGATVDRAAATGWDRPSPCDGWSAADVVAHVVSTQRDFLAEHGHPLEGPSTPEDPAASWHTHADAVTALLDTPGVADTALDSMFGPTTVGAALAEFYGFDLVVHRWDLARAAGTTPDFTDAELDMVEANITAWGDHLYMEGICAGPVEVADDATRTERLLAQTGRDPAA